MKRIQKLLYISLAGVFLFISCLQHETLPGDNGQQDNLKITGAREYFEKAITKASASYMQAESKNWTPGEIIPCWDQATTKQDEQYEYVLVPIYAQNHYVGIQRGVKDSVKRFYRVRVSQFLGIRKDRQDKYSMIYFTLIPAKGYYTENKNQVESKFLKAESYYGDFNGRIAYHNVINSNLMGVDKVTKGKLEWSFWRENTTSKQEFKANYRKMFKNISVYRVIATKTIYDGGELEEADCIWCVKCQEQVDKDHVCPDDEEEEDEENNEGEGNDDWGGNGDNNDNNHNESTGGTWGGGTTGGGSTTKPVTKAYQSQTGDKFAKDGIPITMTTQVASTCVFASMEFVNSLFGGNINYGTYILSYALMYGIKLEYIIQNGITNKNLTNFISKYFKTKPFTNYKDVINKGGVILVDLPVDKNSTHCVIVIGYHPNGNLIYMDPDSGIRMECPATYPAGNIQIAIIGNK